MHGNRDAIGMLLPMVRHLGIQKHLTENQPDFLMPNPEVETADSADLRSRADGLCHLQFCSGRILASDNAKLLGLSHLWNL